MFEENEFGKPISQDLSAIIRRNTEKNDLANVASASGISFSTIRDVVYRTNSVTKTNEAAITELIKIAFNNSLAQQLQAEGDKKFLNRMLRCESE